MVQPPNTPPPYPPHTSAPYPQYPNPYQTPAMMHQPPPMMSQPPPPTHLTSAILSFLFCCWPAGLVAIIYASQVNSKWQMGDYYGAMTASSNARMWSNISIGTMLVVFAVVILAAIADGA